MLVSTYRYGSDDASSDRDTARLPVTSETTVPSGETYTVHDHAPSASLLVCARRMYIQQHRSPRVRTPRFSAAVCTQDVHAAAEKRGRVSSQGTEELAEFVHDRVGAFGRCEMATPIEHRPAVEVGR